MPEQKERTLYVVEREGGRLAVNASDVGKARQIAWLLMRTPGERFDPDDYFVRRARAEEVAVFEKRSEAFGPGSTVALAALPL